jgi:hypothetical protein
MDRQAQLERIDAALQVAGAAADWPALDRLMRALDGQLRTLAAHGPWNAAERTALLRLRASHERLAQLVAGAAQVLQERLHLMRTNEEGWLAYGMHDAMHSELNNDASQGLPR